jgi:hypothetical protein
MQISRLCTDDANFQLTPGTYDSTPAQYPDNRLFLLKLDTTGKLVYSTLVPGNAPKMVGLRPGSDYSGLGAMVVGPGSGRPGPKGAIGQAIHWSACRVREETQISKKSSHRYSRGLAPGGFGPTPTPTRHDQRSRSSADEVSLTETRGDARSNFRPFWLENEDFS